MKFTPVIRKPFVVEAVEVTEDNIAEIAEMVGVLKKKDDGTPFIFVTRRGVMIDRVYLGFWVTRMGDKIHCYSKKIFDAQFTAATDDVLDWVNYINVKDSKDKEPDDLVSVGDSQTD